MKVKSFFWVFWKNIRGKIREGAGCSEGQKNWNFYKLPPANKEKNKKNEKILYFWTYRLLL